MRLDANRNRADREKEERECKQCGRYLNKLYKEELCPSCIEMNLFAEVKEYIRSNIVKESDVAEHFGIPVSKVRSWIKDGRIQYKTEDGKTTSSVYCQVCGKSIEFGTMCADCRKNAGLQVVAKQQVQQDTDSSMRFIGK